MSKTPGLSVLPANCLRGYVLLPGDKSISHRYAILSGMAEGESRIENYSPSLDCASTLGCLRELGVRVSRDDSTVVIQSPGIERWGKPETILDAGNSGTTMRLLSGALASRPFPSTLSGDDSLVRRPMQRIITPLTQMGAEIHCEPGGLPPLQIHGNPLQAIAFVSPIASAQVKSCLLLAGLNATGTTSVTEPAQSRDHTERALPEFGVTVQRRGLTVSVEGPSRLHAANLQVPGDFSGAAFFLAAGLIVPESEILLRGVGVNPTRTGLLDLLREAGCDVRLESPLTRNGEPVADLRVRFTREGLAGFPSSIGGDSIPNLIDEIPLLAVLAPRLPNGLVVKDAAELRGKESDRIRVVCENLRSLGIEVSEQPDGFRVPGGQSFRGGQVRTFGDHRIAMAFAIAALVAEGPVFIDEPECADVSFPGFFAALDSLRK